MQRALIFLKRYYHYFVLGGVVAVGGICWYIPPIHAYLQSNFFPSQEVVAEVPSASPTADRVAAVEELAKQTEQTVVQLQQQHQQDMAQIQSLQDQYKKAVSEVAKVHDAVAKESSQLQAAIESLPAGTVDVSSIVAADPTEAPSGKVNINTASVSQLDSLPGIGATYAQRIVDYRNAHGAFKTVDDLTDVSGIGPATLAKIRDKIEV